MLELHGWGDLQDELNALTKQGAWDKLASVIDDEVLDTFAVIGTPEEAIAEVKRRYGDVATRITLSRPRRRGPRALGPGVRRAALAGRRLASFPAPRRRLPSSRDER